MLAMISFAVVLVLSASSKKNLQIGIDSSTNSQLEIDTSLVLNGLDSILGFFSTSAGLANIDNQLNELTKYQTNIGASLNRL